MRNPARGPLVDRVLHEVLGVHSRKDEDLHGVSLLARLEDRVEDLLDLGAFSRVGRPVLAVARVFVGVVNDPDLVRPAVQAGLQARRHVRPAEVLHAAGRRDLAHAERECAIFGEVDALAALLVHRAHRAESRVERAQIVRMRHPSAGVRGLDLGLGEAVHTDDHPQRGVDPERPGREKLGHERAFAVLKRHRDRQALDPAGLPADVAQARGQVVGDQLGVPQAGDPARRAHLPPEVLDRRPRGRRVQPIGLRVQGPQVAERREVGGGEVEHGGSV